MFFAPLKNRENAKHRAMNVEARHILSTMNTRGPRWVNPRISGSDSMHTLTSWLKKKKKYWETRSWKGLVSEFHRDLRNWLQMFHKLINWAWQGILSKSVSPLQVHSIAGGFYAFAFVILWFRLERSPLASSKWQQEEITRKHIMCHTIM